MYLAASILRSNEGPRLESFQESIGRGGSLPDTSTGISSDYAYFRIEMNEFIPCSQPTLACCCCMMKMKTFL